MFPVLQRSFYLSLWQGSRPDSWYSQFNVSSVSLFLTENTVMQLKITERFYLHNIKWPISFSSGTNHLRHIHLTRLVIFADGVKFVLPLRWRGAPCVLTVQTDTGWPRPRQLPFSKHPQPQAYIGHSGGKKWTNKQTKRKHRNTTSTQSIITPISTTWHGSPFSIWWATTSTASLWGTEILGRHADRHIRHRATVTQHTSTAERPEETPCFDTTHWPWGWESRNVVVVATPSSAPSLPGRAGRNTTTGSDRGVLQPHSARPGSRRFRTLWLQTQKTSPVSHQWQHHKLNSRGDTQLNCLWQHIARRYSCWALDAFSLLKRPTAFFPLFFYQPKSKHHLDTRSYTRRRIHKGGRRRHKHQTPIKHTSTDANQSQNPS